MKKNYTFFSRVYQFSLFLDVSFIHHLILFGTVFLHILSIYLLFIYLSVIYLFICYCCKKHSIAMITQYRVWNLLTAKTPLLQMLYYMTWLTHDFWTRTGGWEFDRSHGAGTSSPSHWQQVANRRRILWVGWCVSSRWPLFPPRSSVLIYIYMHLSSVTGRLYTYNRSFIQYWWSCTPSRSIWLHFCGVRRFWVECHFLFSLVYKLWLALWW